MNLFLYDNDHLNIAMHACVLKLRADGVLEKKVNSHV